MSDWTLVELPSTGLGKAEFIGQADFMQKQIYYVEAHRGAVRNFTGCVATTQQINRVNHMGAD